MHNKINDDISLWQGTNHWRKSFQDTFTLGSLTFRLIWKVINACKKFNRTLNWPCIIYRHFASSWLYSIKFIISFCQRIYVNVMFHLQPNNKFFLFPQCFHPYSRTFCHFHQIWYCYLQSRTLWKSLKFVLWERFSRFYTEKRKTI